MTFRSFLLWALASIPVGVGAVFFVNSRYEIDLSSPNGAALLVSGWLYGVISIWVVVKFVVLRVDFGRIIGVLPQNFQWGPLVALVAAILVFSFGGALITAYLFTRYTEWPITEFGDELELAVPILVLTAAILAPLWEELLFRGVLLHRWAHKWSPTRGILLSSLIFALLHVDTVGAFVFGLVMCILYVKTHTLIVPVIAHALNNIAVTPFLALAVKSDVSANPSTGELWLGLAMVLLTAPWLGWFILRNWPRTYAELPYFANDSRRTAEAQPSP
ncbi:MAG: CPBP family intramembrane metalloprotease [Chloroflexi bacterium]|nr:CPBP family intramembrane metalloprotease [Chloroflexota bacterium]